MAHKKGRGRGDSSDPDDLTRTPLQAVLLADSFATKFRPITLERPKVLLPLVNVPMIEYTLAWLESVGVEEVFVFSCANSGQVKAYLNGSDWTKSSEVFSVNVIESNDAMSVGDALRAIYSHSVIHGDFILISGDTVSNMSLTQALQKHKERRKKDPLSIMTMVIKHSKPSSLAHQTRLGTDEIVMAIDPETQELLYYEDKADSSEWSISLDKMLLADKPALYLLNDMQIKSLHACVEKGLKPVSPENIEPHTIQLLERSGFWRFRDVNGRPEFFDNSLKDCYIDICSPEVLSLFTDNFDYQHLRRHFVKGLLVDDIMGYKIFTHEIHSSYAARVDSLRSYDTISKDIMQRWTYPFVPDVQYFGNMSQMKLDREGIYKASEVIQSRSARIGPFSLVGNGTTVGDHSCIFNSVIGKGCTVGRNVSIHGSYIWDNVTIEDNCTINYALVCDDVHLSTGVVLEPGVVLSFKVQVGKQFVVPAHSKVSLHPQPAKQDSDEELEYADFNNGVFESPSITNMVKNGNAELTPYALELGISEVGISGVGYIWAACETGLEEEWRHSIAPIPAEKLKEYFLGLPRGCDESSQDVKPLLAPNKLLPDCESADFDDADDADDDYRDSAHFEEEVDATFRRALNGVDQDNVIIEINSLRLAFNVEYKDCVGALFYSIMKSAYDDSSKDNLLANTSKAIKKWKDLLKNYLKTEDEEIEVIMKFEEMCLESAKGFFPHINSILFCLYENDIVTEDAIFTWANEKEGGDEADKICLKEADKFIAWLRTAEEEEDDDEDKDEEEDDEDKDKDEDGDDE